VTHDAGLRVVLGLLAAYHLAIGLISVASHRWTARLTRGLYALSMGEDARFRYAVKMLGLYALALGALLALAARDPAAHRPIVAAITFLQAARGLSRLAFRRLLAEGFGVPPRRNAAHACFLMATAALLAWWFP
jgi:hypothetical protein